MKLGELRGAIRKTKGAPFMDAFPFPGTENGFRFVLQKTPLLEELERAYPGGKATETGLTFNVETGHLKPEATGVAFEAVRPAAKTDNGPIMPAEDRAIAPAEDSAIKPSKSDFDDLL